MDSFRDFIREQEAQDDQPLMVGISTPDGKNNHTHQVFVNRKGNGWTSEDEGHKHKVIGNHILHSVTFPRHDHGMPGEIDGHDIEHPDPLMGR